MTGPDLPARPQTPVPQQALDALLAALPRCVDAPLEPGPSPLIDPVVARAQARRFKLDLSFRLGLDAAPWARWSINDKGEPEAFRARLRAAAPRLGLDPARLERFLAISPPGEVQTTLSVKWGAAGGLPERVGLYFEELMGCPRAQEIIDDVLGLIGASALPPPPGALPGAASVDLTHRGFTGARDYWLGLDDARGPLPDLPLPPAAQRFRSRLPLHPQNGTRRFLLARRAGPRAGTKLLWLTESHHPSSAARAWAVVDALRAELGLPDSPPARALDALRRGWPLPEDEVYLYPDLVCLDCDGAGEPEALLLYVSVK